MVMDDDESDEGRKQLRVSRTQNATMCMMIACRRLAAAHVFRGAIATLRKCGAAQLCMRRSRLRSRAERQALQEKQESE